ncbi:hypothetical protein ABEB36_012715 [Hypothenemus hampei]|uniref:Retrotransposon gag domain-containing protein n=1 Tax=Hypothenemus hampei TaxID=57062 RepID=A0ABD1EC60_HYPHA
MGKSDIEIFYENLVNFKVKLGKDNKERCADNTVTTKKWAILQALIKTYNESVRLETTDTDLKYYDEKIRASIKVCADILRTRQRSNPAVNLDQGAQTQDIGSSTSIFCPLVNSTALALQPDQLTHHLPSLKKLSSSSITSEEDPLQITIVPLPDKNQGDIVETPAEPAPPQRQAARNITAQESTNGQTMAATDSTINDALRQIIDPATPKFVQPPIFRPATDSPSSFLLGYERAAIGNGWTDIYKILYLGQFLESPAHKWYQKYLSNERNNANNWEMIKRDFKVEFMDSQQREVTSGPFFHRKQGHTEEVKHYYYELLDLADERGRHGSRNPEKYCAETTQEPRITSGERRPPHLGAAFATIIRHTTTPATAGTAPEIRGKEIPIPGPVPSKPHDGDHQIIKDDQIIINTKIIICSNKVTSPTQELGMVDHSARAVGDTGTTVAAIILIRAQTDTVRTQTGQNDSNRQPSGSCST